MRILAEQIRAKLEIQSDAGTTVRLSFPIGADSNGSMCRNSQPSRDRKEA